MIQRTLALLILIFALIGATPAISRDYAIVDDDPFTVRGYYLTIGAALQSGASTIEIREGVYPESVTIDRPLTLLCREGATLVNDGLSTSVTITATVSIKNCEIEGNHAGGEIGGYGDGTGVYVTAAGVHLDGLITRNLKSFSVLAVGTSDLLLENYAFYNVATDPNTPLLAQYAIHLNGVDDSIVRNGYAEGHSQVVGLWYHADNNRVYGNRFVNNYGYVGTVGNYVPRSVVEIYGVTDAENNNNWFYDNEIDGGRGAIEIADILNDTVVRNNIIRNTDSCFVALGSGTNHSTNLTIEGNHCYGNGQPNQASNHITGKQVTVKDNWFYDYNNTNTGTLYVWGGTAAAVVIDGNTFVSNGMIARLSANGVTFRNNTAIDTTHAHALYLESVTANTVIDGNILTGGIRSNDVQGVTIRGNVIGGEVWLGGVSTKSVIIDNDIFNPIGYGLLALSESDIRDNRIKAIVPVLVPSNLNYLRLADNFLTSETGGAVGLPACSGTNTCSGNWTVGQVPPP